MTKTSTLGYLRLLSCVALGVVIAAIADFVLGEFAVIYEMQATGATDRAELSDDMGLGMLGLLIVLPCACSIGGLATWLFLRLSKRLTRKS